MMNPSTSSVPDLAVFVKLVSNCFTTVSGTTPVFGASTIELGLPLLFQYSGFIVVKGPLNGWICLSLPATVADELLDALQEPMHDEEFRLDLAGEVAQTVAANARLQFGDTLEVFPAVVTGDSTLARSLVPPNLILRLPFAWRNYNAQLLVSLNT